MVPKDFFDFFVCLFFHKWYICKFSKHRWFFSGKQQIHEIRKWVFYHKMKPYVIVQNKESFLWSYFGRLHFYFKFKTHDNSNYWRFRRCFCFAPFSSEFLIKLLQKLQGMSALVVTYFLYMEVKIGSALLASESSILFFLHYLFFC